MAGPRSEPPMPMLTTLVIGWPVDPAIPGADPCGEDPHSPQHLMDPRHNIVPPASMGSLAGARRATEDRPVLGDVDVFARPHGVDACTQPGPFGQVDEQADLSAARRFLE